MKYKKCRLYMIVKKSSINDKLNQVAYAKPLILLDSGMVLNVLNIIRITGVKCSSPTVETITNTGNYVYTFTITQNDYKKIVKHYSIC